MTLAPSMESPGEAVERALLAIDVTPRLAVLAATVRELARALSECEPADKAKTSRELNVRMNELLAEGRSDVDDDDWTQRAGLTAIRDAS